ncbi:MAG: glycosyltransferase family 39 protein [Solirubrobacteraceae bacterium]
MTSSESLRERPAPREPPIAPAAAPARSPWRADPRILNRLAIGVPMAIAAVLTLIEINGRSIGFDEAATVTIALQHSSALGAAIAHDGGNMSGYYLLLHVLMSAFGDGELVLRLPSAVAAVATVGIVGAIALRLFGRLTAVAAGLLCAVSLPLVFWAQNARGYALMVAFVCAAYLALVSLDDQASPPARSGSRARFVLWAAFALAMTLATYASFVAVLVVPAQLAAFCARSRRARLRPFSLAIVAYAVLCTPLIVLASQRGSGQLFWVPRPTREIEQQVLESLTSAGLEPSFHATATTMVLMGLTTAALLVIAGGFMRAHRRGEPAWGGAVILTWLAVPVTLSFLYSLVAQPIFLPRNLLMSVPAVALVLAAGLRSPRLPRRAALGLLAVALLLRGAQVIPSYTSSPEPWQQASAMVLRQARPGDCIAFYPLDGRMAFQYYFARSRDGHAPSEILPIAPWYSTQIFVERYYVLSPAQIAYRGRGCRRLWFVSSHEGQRDGPAASLDHANRFKVLSARLEHAFGNAPIRQLGYAAAIHVQLLPGPLKP